MSHYNNRIFVCADLHFGHSKLVGYEPGQRRFDSIKEHDEFIVARWNDTVRNKDTVIVLGDIHFGPPEELKILKKLKGLKKLVLGNHDKRPVREYGEYFSKIHGALVIHSTVLTHIPVHPLVLERWRGNIHGHLHSECLRDARYWCVSLEQTAYRPLELDFVLGFFPEKASTDEN